MKILESLAFSNRSRNHLPDGPATPYARASFFRGKRHARIIMGTEKLGAGIGDI